MQLKPQPPRKSINLENRTSALWVVRRQGAGQYIHHRAHPAHAMGTFVTLDKRVPYPDSLAKYAAAFFKMSRSSLTRLSSALSLRSSSVWDNCSLC